MRVSGVGVYRVRINHLALSILKYNMPVINVIATSLWQCVGSRLFTVFIWRIPHWFYPVTETSLVSVIITSLCLFALSKRWVVLWLECVTGCRHIVIMLWFTVYCWISMFVLYIIYYLCYKCTNLFSASSRTIYCLGE